ncbi:LacI family DNA-binding transcriptional regulator [Paenibacillus alvei]|uniref:LacI family DNA-binding transcriptional regulator n=1 Tax=Paenibacillus alvei TaxID=44250 RepID=A0AAP6ZUC0_PAEAL|nr:LacI family DNA-binding transcriptional regulator [Paenibacillus alvei]MBG9734867.1 LacI family transcriptional regulator [Paenibacillus alvei]MBG9744742.1 LacI family transcriptional regulator [Paenibacillus alvei]MCY9578835.1 LacI family transcriptional regulator [Paenibacillus alvei]MCY9583891.1 LacI family transcriptional regulator [Paenibacillus alvei]NEZ41499.1 LacI family DNA-binding transcriptional regulator [Paenibacillus alvei]
MARLKDIAEMVGVSISTVSRVINQDDSRRISEETKQKIWQAAKQLNYPLLQTAKPRSRNRLRHSPSPATTHAIGCILSLPDNKYNHPYFSPIIQGIEAKLLESGASLAFLHTQAELKSAALFESLLRSCRLSGIICVEGMNPEQYKWLKERVPNIVGIDVADPTVPVISYDRMNAARVAVGHLIQNGHRKIGFIGGRGLLGQLEREKRYRGYRIALEEAGCELNPNWVIDAEWDADRSYDGMKQLVKLEDRPTAMFCASDMMAIAAMRAVAEEGMSIPSDIAFIGVDDIEFAKYSSPPLSSIHIPKYEMGYAAAKALLDGLTAPYPTPFRMLLPFELVVRESTNSEGAS